MFCPVCKAEFRQGFTHCSDCDVDLVYSYEEAFRHPLAEEVAAPENYPSLLWRGEEPRLYLSIISALIGKQVSCLGRPSSPPVPDSYGRHRVPSEPPEFEVWVAEENLAVSRRILAVTLEEMKRADQEVDEQLEEDAQPSSGLAGVCPLCFGEFPSPHSTCPACDVPLHSSAKAAAEENPSRVLSNVPHPLFFDALASALLDAGIKFRNARYFRRGAVASLSYVPSHDIVVLKSDFDRATEVLSRILGHWVFEPTSLVGRWPAAHSEEPWLGDADRLLPGDLTARIWAGSDISLRDFLCQALREQHIPYRVNDASPDTSDVFVLPTDEPQAQEILREIAEASPLE